MAKKQSKDAMVDEVIFALDLILCENDNNFIAESASWILFKHPPADGWRPLEQPPLMLVGRAAYESGALQKKTTLIASSRLPKNLESHATWFDAIRTIGARLAPDTHALLTATGMAADPYARRIATLFDIDLIEAQLISPDQLRTSADLKHDTDKVFFIYEREPDSPDAQLINMANTVHALAVRRGGNVHQAIATRLQNQPTPPVRLLSNSTLTKTKTKTELLELGAIDWILLANEDDPSQENDAAKQMSATVPLDSIEQSQYLLHWARRQSNAWPDQEKDAHLDQLIFGSAVDRYQEVMTLCRIIASNRLIGAAHLTRDPAPVVCFTAVPLGELPKRTVFRKHLARWDFVPYGLAIRKSVLQSAGCKEVIYGDDSDWETLSKEDRPWFQLKKSRNGKIDWTQEHEWRLQGDLDLSKIGADDAFAFVKTHADARRLAGICRWPIVVLYPTGL